VSESERILALLADPDRFRVASALALGATSVTDVERMSGLDQRTIERALGRLIAGGLVTKERESGHRFATEELLLAARDAAERRGESDPHEPEVVRRFMRGGRLTEIPSNRSKRLAVLDRLAQEFEPGRRYPERQVNEILGRFHQDVASLRRYLVDEGFMERARGRYWRTGGTFAVQ
jgi:hypothetical protein